MGRQLLRAVLERDDMCLVAAAEAPGDAALGVDAGTLVGVAALGVTLGDDIAVEAGSGDVEVVVDFTTPAASIALLERLAGRGTGVVLGATGMDAAQRSRLAELSTELPIVYAANYSVGVTLALDLLERAARALDEDYDIEVIETHHRHKVDAPSGTALAMGEALSRGRGRALDEVAVYAREGITGERERGAIGFATVRAGDVVGEHTVLFGAVGERLEITPPGERAHDVRARRGAGGAVARGRRRRRGAGRGRRRGRLRARPPRCARRAGLVRHARRARARRAGGRRAAREEEGGGAGMSIAVVFPGQGSQSVGMLAALAAAEPLVGDTFARAAEVLGTDLWALAQAGPAEALADTRVTQPLMFVADVAVWRVLETRGLPTPVAVAGHSLGEFAAMVAAGAMGFEDGLRLVERRAALMAAAVPAGSGGMAALIGMDDEAVVALCEETRAALGGDRVVEAVNFNAPGQVAISGHVDALEAAVAAARDKGVRKALMLPVSVPNHSSLMRAAGAELAEAIDALPWRLPAVPLVQNAPAAAPDSLEVFLGRLREHVYSPVRWSGCVTALRDAHGARVVLEVGPGKVLAGLGKRIDRALPTYPVESPETLSEALAAVGAVGAVGGGAMS